VTLVVSVHDTLRFAADGIRKPGSIAVKRTDVRRAQHAIFVPSRALHQPRGDCLPLAEVLIDEPIDQIGDSPLYLLRRISDDPVFELLLYTSAIDQVEQAANAKRVFEERMSARFHLDQYFFDRCHP
jgi:hypothetical protein